MKNLPALALLALCLGSLSTSAWGRHDAAQMCWSLGKFDNTVYFAEIESREDRRASFASLLEVSGIENYGVQCIWHDIADHRRLVRRMVDDWMDLELEVVNTTFMSDLDY